MANDQRIKHPSAFGIGAQGEHLPRRSHQHVGDFCRCVGQINCNAGGVVRPAGYGLPTRAGEQVLTPCGKRPRQREIIRRGGFRVVTHAVRAGSVAAAPGAVHSARHEACGRDVVDGAVVPELKCGVGPERDVEFRVNVRPRKDRSARPGQCRGIEQFPAANNLRATFPEAHV